jgi:3-deoxy-D-manno-octulosonic-acid transferase
MNYYAIADIVFVGGSLVKKGGHNILEPALQEKPIFFGPYMFNFRDIAELFLKNQAAILVHNKEELKERIKDLLRNQEKTRQFCQRAKELILKNQGATQKNLKLIRNLYAKISL